MSTTQKTSTNTLNANTIDPLGGKTISFADAAKLVNVKLPTVHKWRKHGVKCGDRYIKLEFVRIGGAYRTTEAALRRFIAATQNPEDEQDGDSNGVTAPLGGGDGSGPQFRTNHPRAAATLEAAGYGVSGSAVN